MKQAIKALLLALTLTGSLVWSFPTADGVTSQPANDGDESHHGIGLIILGMPHPSAEPSAAPTTPDEKGAVVKESDKKPKGMVIKTSRQSSSTFSFSPLEDDAEEQGKREVMVPSADEDVMLGKRGLQAVMQRMTGPSLWPVGSSISKSADKFRTSLKNGFVVVRKQAKYINEKRIANQKYHDMNDRYARSWYEPHGINGGRVWNGMEVNEPF